MTLEISERVRTMKPSATLGMAQAARELAALGVDVVVMSAGEPDFAAPRVVCDVLNEALKQGKTHYAPVRGSKIMISAMQEKFQRDQKIAYDADQVMCTVGAKAAILMALEAVVNHGDEVIIFAPFWVSYAEQVRLAGGEPVIVSCAREHDFMPTGEDLRRAITPKTKAIILNSPNNPSGGVISKAHLEELASVLQNTAIWVISDEIYEKLLYNSYEHFSPASISDHMRERTIVISGASKAYAMTGFRVGVVAGSKPIIAAMEKLQGQQTTCLPEFIQEAAAFALRENPAMRAEMDMMIAAYKERNDLAIKLFTNIPHVDVYRSKGAFYLWADFSAYVGKEVHGQVIADDIDLATRMLREAHVASVPGTPFGGPGFIRFSIASSAHDIERAAARIHGWLT